MPSTLTYPGVYIEEIPSGVRTITGVATSITAFIGRTARGPVNEPVTVTSYREFERRFGGLAPAYTVAYAVQDFFANGGSTAIIVRLYKPFFADEATRQAAVAAATAAAQSAANAVRDAAIAAAGLGGATATSTAAAATGAVAGAAGSPERIAGQAVADAANAEATRPANQTATQVITLSGGATGGKITLGFKGETIDLTFNQITDTLANARAAIKGALEGLTTVGAGNIGTINRSGATPDFVYRITLAGPLATPPQPLFSAVNGLTGGVNPNVAVAYLPADPASVVAAATTAATTAAATAAQTVAPRSRAQLTIPSGLVLEATAPGTWGNSLKAGVDYDTRPNDDGSANASLFNLTVIDGVTGRMEQYRNVSVDPNATRRVDLVLRDESTLVSVITPLPANRPAAVDVRTAPIVVSNAALGTDSQPLLQADFLGSENNKTGIYALEKADLFNLLCLPADTRSGDIPAKVYQDSLAYCVRKRAMLLVDPPNAWGANPDTAVSTALGGLSGLGLNGPAARNAALFFPRILKSDTARDGQIDTFVPCGLIAGIFARTDTTRGVWKAPAGLDASLNGISGLQAKLSDGDIGQLNPVAINTLRIAPGAGPVIWGARTMRGADSFGDEYRYIPVRRLALYIEETLFRATQWVVFEPNDEPLWAQIRLNVGAFMHSLFRQGAFQGTSPKDAYFVKCDKETTTQDDINRGVLNILVGFAPLKPAEFVVIQLQQMAGQIET